MYYRGKESVLKDLFNAEIVVVEPDWLLVDNTRFPIVNDVIILLHSAEYPKVVSIEIHHDDSQPDSSSSNFSRDIQFTFGEEWKQFSSILPEHESEFEQYFDLINASELQDSRICDLGCGIGRWSYFLASKCKEIVLIDFSEAIFVARENLKESSNALFFMANLTKLPFRNDFSDFLFCLGVLHHLPTPALEEVKQLKKLSPRLLIYLYYALDNRPYYFRILLSLVNIIRLFASKIKNPKVRNALTWWIAATVYLPLIGLGKILNPFHLTQYIPICEAYNRKGFNRICQDVYDRFFTPIEQRYTKNEILTLRSDFSQVLISEGLPYWHFLCKR